MRHLFVTQDYPPDLGGMARRHVELCRHFSPERVTVSTGFAGSSARDFDDLEGYAIERQPFAAGEAKLFVNQLRWCRTGGGLVHLGLSRIDSEVGAEGFGISFIEAAASGVPAVAGDSGGVRSTVRDGKTGLVVPPTDVDAVTAAVRLLLTDSDRRTMLGAAARRAVETHDNWDRVARETMDFARSLTPGPGALR